MGELITAEEHHRRTISQLHAEKMALEARLDRAEALLALFAMPTGPHYTHGDGTERCGYCGGYYVVNKDDGPPKVDHSRICPIMKARAHLARYKEEN